jgi:hypothetical protein
MSGTVPASFANQFFNATFYLENNPDVVAGIAAGNFTSALQHFELFGQFENRMPNASFNANQYLINNPDVAAAVGARTIGSAWEHFVTFGVAENRSDGSFPGTFNETAYLAANPDVAAAVAAGDYINGYEHFLLYGQFENRPGTPTGAPGQTFTLTTNADIIPGLIGSGGSPNTTGNDTIFGIVDGNTALSTLNAADNLHPTGANETLSLTAQDGAATMPSALLNGINTLSVRNVGGNIFIADASLVPGVTAVNSNLSDGTSFSDVTFTDVPSGASVGDIGNGVTASSDLTATYVAAATLAAINISGGTKVGTAPPPVSPANVDVTGSGVTSTVVSSAGAANTIGGLDISGTTLTINAATNLKTAGITDAALTGINVSGAATLVDLGTNAPTVKSVNASGLTAGGVRLDASAALTPAAFTFTGGAGDNTLILAPTELTTLTAGSQLDGGVGGTNTLQINDASLTAADITTLNAVTNFTVLSLGVPATIDASQISAAFPDHFALAVGNTGANMITGLANGATVDLLDASGPDTFATSGALDMLNLNIGTSTSAGLLFAGPVTPTNVSTINLTSNGTGATGTVNTIDFLNADNTTFNVTGSEALTLGLAPALVAGDKVNAAGFTGNLTVMNSGKGDILTGGTGKDAFLLTTGASTVTGGAGADKMEFLSSTGGTGNIDTFTDFTSGSDQLDFSKLAFGNITAAAGSTLNAADFLSVANAAALTSTDVQPIVFNQSTHALDYNATGGDPTVAGTLTQIATINNTAPVLADLHAIA